MSKRLVAWAFRSGVRKGIVGGSGPWLVVAVAAGAIRFLNRPPRSTESIKLNLRPGERYSIVCAEEPTRSSR